MTPLLWQRPSQNHSAPPSGCRSTHSPPIPNLIPVREIPSFVATDINTKESN